MASEVPGCRVRDERKRPVKGGPGWGLPELHLTIYARRDGLVIQAHLHVRRPGEQPRVEWIADVLCHPSEVTEEKVVQWAIGALSTWLVGKAEAAAEAVYSAS